MELRKGDLLVEPELGRAYRVEGLNDRVVAYTEWMRGSAEPMLRSASRIGFEVALDAGEIRRVASPKKGGPK